MTTTRPPHLGPEGSDRSGAFVQAVGFVVDQATKSACSGYLDVGPEHHTPWGVVHGGVYSTAVESAASIGACAAVAERAQVAVGLTNTTQFLRSITEGRLRVEARALHQGRTQQLWAVDITDEAGRRVAHGELRLQNIDAVAR